MHVSDWRKRSLLTRFRAGVSPLRIETGRYEANGSGTRGIPAHDRICLCCGLGVESELHMFIDCPLYDEIRKLLINVCTLYNEGQQDIDLHINITSPSQFFINTMQCTDYYICNAVADYIWSAFEIRAKYLESVTS